MSPGNILFMPLPSPTGSWYDDSACRIPGSGTEKVRSKRVLMISLL